MKENKKYFWLKLKEDFFRNKKIKKLRKIAGGDTYTIIYLKMQLLSLKHGGELYFEDVEETFAEEIALEIDEDIDNVKVTLMFLLKNGLIEQVGEDEYSLIETKQCIGSETASTIRSRKSRALKQEKEQKVLQCNADATICNTEIDIEKEKEIELDIEKRKKNKDIKKDKTYFDNEDLNSLFIEFLEVRKKLKAVNSERAINTLLKTLAAYDDDTKYKMIENSVVNSWKSVYPLKEEKKTTYYKREEIVPDWFNKDVKGNNASEEETAEMEALLGEITGDVVPFEERKRALQEKLKSKYGKDASNTIVN